MVCDVGAMQLYVTCLQDLVQRVLALRGVQPHVSAQQQTAPPAQANVARRGAQVGLLVPSRHRPRACGLRAEQCIPLAALHALKAALPPHQPAAVAQHCVHAPRRVGQAGRAAPSDPQSHNVGL